MTLKDIPICFVWEDRGIPTVVVCDGRPGMMVSGLRAGLPMLRRLTVAESARIFGRQFAADLKRALQLITQKEEINAMKGHA